MDESSRHWVSRCIHYVKYKIERCIQNYMSKEETMKYLEENLNIHHTMTKAIWEALEKANPDFFKNFYLRCEIIRQKQMFDDFLMKQVALMLVNGHIDIQNASPKLVAFLSEDPEGIRLLASLANTSPNMSSPSSSSPPLPNTNGPTVNQLQIPPIEQQNQMPTISNHLPYHNLGAPIIAPAATDQLCSLPCYLPGGPTDPWPSLDEVAYIRAPTIAPEVQQQPYGGGTNGMQSVNQQQQPQGVILHHPHHPERHEVGPYQNQNSETDALNNPANGYGTLTAAQNQYNLLKERRLYH